MLSRVDAMSHIEMINGVGFRTENQIRNFERFSKYAYSRVWGC